MLCHFEGEAMTRYQDMSDAELLNELDGPDDIHDTYAELETPACHIVEDHKPDCIVLFAQSQEGK